MTLTFDMEFEVLLFSDWRLTDLLILKWSFENLVSEEEALASQVKAH